MAVKFCYGVTLLSGQSSSYSALELFSEECGHEQGELEPLKRNELTSSLSFIDPKTAIRAFDIEA